MHLCSGTGLHIVAFVTSDAAPYLKPVPVLELLNSVFQAQAVVPSVNLHSQNPRLLQSPGLPSASGAEAFSFPPSSCQGEAAFMEEERVETPKVQLEITLLFVGFFFFQKSLQLKKSICLLKAQHCFLKFKYLSIKNRRYCTFSFPVTLHSWVFFHHSSASCSLLTLHSHHTAFGKGQNLPKRGFLSLILLKYIFKSPEDSSFLHRRLMDAAEVSRRSSSLIWSQQLEGEIA